MTKAVVAKINMANNFKTNVQDCNTVDINHWFYMSINKNWKQNIKQTEAVKQGIKTMTKIEVGCFLTSLWHSLWWVICSVSFMNVLIAFWLVLFQMVAAFSSGWPIWKPTPFAWHGNRQPIRGACTQERPAIFEAERFLCSFINLCHCHPLFHKIELPLNENGMQRDVLNRWWKRIYV